MKPNNETLELLNQHVSVRQYLDKPVSEEQLAAIIGAGQMASTSSNVQAYSVIAVTEPGLKAQLAALSGNQAYIEQCPVFLVWCADLYRLHETTAHYLQSAESFDSTENFIVATVDAALAAQNAAIAAESLGMGIVYIGGVRNNIAELSELLNLPERVYPVFGMCLGYPAGASDCVRVFRWKLYCTGTAMTRPKLPGRLQLMTKCRVPICASGRADRVMHPGRL